MVFLGFKKSSPVPSQLKPLEMDWFKGRSTGNHGFYPQDGRWSVKPILVLLCNHWSNLPAPRHLSPNRVPPSQHTSIHQPLVTDTAMRCSDGSFLYHWTVPARVLVHLDIPPTHKVQLHPPSPPPSRFSPPFYTPIHPKPAPQKPRSARHSSRSGLSVCPCLESTSAARPAACAATASAAALRSRAAWCGWDNGCSVVGTTAGDSGFRGGKRKKVGTS